MQVKIELHGKHPLYAEIVSDLAAEIDALQRPGVSVTRQQRLPQEDELVLGEVAQFIIDNQDAIVNTTTFITALVQLSNEVMRRRGIQKAAKPSKLESVEYQTVDPATLTVGKHRLILPCTDAQAKTFIKKVMQKANPKKGKDI